MTLALGWRLARMCFFRSQRQLDRRPQCEHLKGRQRSARADRHGTVTLKRRATPGAADGVESVPAADAAAAVDSFP